jgi:hypothetical protein
MNRLLISAALLLVTAFAPLLHRPQDASQQAVEVNWRTDYASARTEANAAGKPLFVIFRCER